MMWKHNRKQKLCKHETFHENMQCHGICMECDKDLGFIGGLDRSKCVADNDPGRWNRRPTANEVRR
jgi:hypothetical protein